MIVYPKPFDVLHEHFGNIGALDVSFYFIGLKIGKLLVHAIYKT
jgi:hypothetical protein